MDRLRMGLVGLSAAEHALVAAFFRLHRFEASFIWSLTSEPPYDALLIDSSICPDEFEHLKSRHTQVKRLGALEDARADEMPRPIQSDVLLQWLKTMEDGLLHGQRDDFPLTVIEQVSEVAGLARPSVDTSVAPASEMRLDDTLFRLRRWPTQSLLSSDMSRIRIATMLARREMSLRQLEEATGVSAGTCKMFIHALDQAGLLIAETLAPAQTQSENAPEAWGKGHQPIDQTHGVELSSLRSIRQGFGL